MVFQLEELAAEHQMATNQLKVAHLEEIQELRNKHDLQMEGEAWLSSVSACPLMIFAGHAGQASGSFSLWWSIMRSSMFSVDAFWYNVLPGSYYVHSFSLLPVTPAGV